MNKAEERKMIYKIMAKRTGHHQDLLESHLQTLETLTPKEAEECMLEFAASQPATGLRWVKASERLPSIDEHYHCRFIKTKSPLIIRYRNDEHNLFHDYKNDIEWLEEFAASQKEGSKLNLQEIEKNIDTILENETAESLNKFLEENNVTSNSQQVCETCGGDGKETCTNPDHGFIGAMGGDVGRLGCPVCGHDENHKVINGGKCEDCNGTGYVPDNTASSNIVASHVSSSAAVIVLYSAKEDAEIRIDDSDLNLTIEKGKITHIGYETERYYEGGGNIHHEEYEEDLTEKDYELKVVFNTELKAQASVARNDEQPTESSLQNNSRVEQLEEVLREARIKLIEDGFSETGPFIKKIDTLLNSTNT